MDRAWRAVIAFVGAASSAAACGAAPEQAPTRAARAHTGAKRQASLAGCYALFDHAGRPASDSLYWAPAVARLARGGKAVKLVPPGSAAEAGMAEERSWQVDSLTDTVRVLFHSGFSGTEFAFALGPGGDTLRGRAIEHWDFPPFETDAGPAHAVRVPCPAG